MDVSTEMPDDTTKVQPRRVRHVDGRRRRKQPAKACYLTLQHLDQRSEASRRARQLIETLEFERGGPDQITEGMKQLCQRAAVLGAIIEDHEARWINGETIDLAGYLSAVGVQRRVLISLGLQRQSPKDITPSLGSYLQDRAEPDDTADGGPDG